MGYPNTHTVTFVYKNHRGEVSRRTVTPYELKFKTSQWHEVAQWLLEGWDHDKEAFRTFALKDISGWRPIDPALLPALGNPRQPVEIEHDGRDR